jgi:hypothetical protein
MTQGGLRGAQGGLRPPYETPLIRTC